jgi:hypothetical protein
MIGEVGISGICMAQGVSTPMIANGGMESKRSVV